MHAEPGVDLHAFGQHMQNEWGLDLVSLFEQFGTDAATAEGAWRAQFGDREWLFTDVTSFCRIAASIEAVLDIVYQSDVPAAVLHGESLPLDELIAAILWEPEGAGADLSWTIGSFRECFGADGVPMPIPGRSSEQAIIEACSFGVVGALRAMHERFGPHPLDGDGVAELLRLCLRSHLGSAPERVAAEIWPQGKGRSGHLDPATGFGLVADRLGTRDLRIGLRTSSALGWDPEKEPIDALDHFIDGEASGSNEIRQAQSEVDAVARADGHVRAHLEDIRDRATHSKTLLSVDADLLRRGGLDPGPLAACTARINKARLSSGIGKLLSGGSSGDEVIPIIDGLIDQWAASISSRTAAVMERKQAAERARDDQKRRFHVWGDGMLDFVLGRDLAPVEYQPGAGEAYLAGTLQVGLSGDYVVPWFLPVEGSPTLVFYPSRANFDRAVSQVQTLLASRLAYVPARQLLFTWLDPAGHGASAGPFVDLLAADSALLDGRVWAEPEQMTDKVRALTRHLEEVHQKCLRNDFPDLRSYNAHAGVLIEPYRALVITGFPAGLDEDTGRRVLALAEHGPAAGIQTILVIDETATAHWLTEESIAGLSRRIDVVGAPTVWDYIPYVHADRTTRLVYDSPRLKVPEIERIVQAYGAASRSARTVAISSQQRYGLAEEGLWQESSAERLVVPVGVTGGRDDLSLEFGRQDHLVVGGMPGFGKSNFIYTLVAASIARYSPDELELYLIDLKEGVGFKPYATHQLPHARVVAIEADREFALSVLKGVESEMRRRGVLFKSASGDPDNIERYRELAGERLPRILLVVDEFHALFSDNASLAQDILERILREGLAFGIHVVLGSQTLSGVDPRVRTAVLRLCRLRVLLKVTDADSRTFLDDSNPAGAALTRPGEAIFNGQAGALEANTRFQVALTSEEENGELLRRQRLFADERGFADRQPIVFDGSAVMRLFDHEPFSSFAHGRTPSMLTSSGICLWLGSPLAIESTVAVELRRERGSNAVLVGRAGPDDLLGAELVEGLIVASLVSVVRGGEGARPRILVIDCLSVDDPAAGRLRAWCEALDIPTPLRRRDLGLALSELAAEVQRRVAEDDINCERIVLLVRGLQQARELEADPLALEPGPTNFLQAVLKDGPDFGIHSVITVDTVASLLARVGREGLAELRFRVALRLNQQSSYDLGSAVFENLRDNQAALLDSEQATERKLRPFAPPEPGLLRDLMVATPGGVE